ncbi:unnamed protein product [Effrenium voratum]|nr:unnamed protein product [Effrenium voratum]
MPPWSPLDVLATATTAWELPLPASGLRGLCKAELRPGDHVYAPQPAISAGPSDKFRQSDSAAMESRTALEALDVEKLGLASGVRRFLSDETARSLQTSHGRFIRLGLATVATGAAGAAIWTLSAGAAGATAGAAGATAGAASATAGAASATTSATAGATAVTAAGATGGCAKFEPSFRPLRIPKDVPRVWWLKPFSQSSSRSPLQAPPQGPLALSLVAL